MPPRLRFRYRDAAAGGESLDPGTWRPEEGPIFGAPPLAGARVVNAILPTGRIAWFRISPALAAAGETNHFLQAADRVRERRGDTLRGMTAGLALSGQALDEARLRRNRRLRRRLVRVQRRLDRRLSRDFAGQRARVAELRQGELALVRRLASRGVWDDITVASSAPLFAFFGRRGRLFDSSNVTLLLSLALWVVGDDILRWFSQDAVDRRTYLRDADFWSYLAPFANVLGGWWLLHERPRRFVTGVVFDGRTDLRWPRRGAFDLTRYERRDHPTMGSTFEYVAVLKLTPELLDHLEDVRDRLARRNAVTEVPLLTQVTALEWSPRPASVAKAFFSEARGSIEDDTLVLRVKVAAFDPVKRQSRAGFRPVRRLAVAFVLDTQPAAEGARG
jgi:hypothetical protein